ncbi:hypothetical protein KA005_59910, partial [bacterium]|nr:hypothetical protein [bacterium]
MKKVNVAVICAMIFLPAKMLFSAEPRLDFDNGTCKLGDLIQNVKESNAVSDVSRPTVFQSSYGIMDFHELNQKLSKLEPYMRAAAEKGQNLQIFDADAALKDGFSEDVIALAQEMVDYQNAAAPAIEKFPRLKVFFDMVWQNHLNGGDCKADVNPCGDFDHPVPNYSPPWNKYSSSNPEQELIKRGFHRTTSYACEPDCKDDSGRWLDFTQGVGYSGPYGYCRSPRFR